MYFFEVFGIPQSKGPLVAPKLIFLPSSVRDCSPIGFGFLRSATEQKAERKNWGGDLATHQFYTAKARPALAGTPTINLKSKQPVIVAVNKKLGMTAAGKSCLRALFWVKFFDFYGIWAHARNPRNMVSFCHWVV